MGFGIFLMEVLKGTGWQLYVPHFVQILCTMSFGTCDIIRDGGPCHYYSNVRLLPCTEIQAGSRIEAGSRIGKITQWAPCVLL